MTVLSKSKPKISVLMTTYNRALHVDEAIESVLNSTILDFELIIVDDCSKDNTLEIVQGYASQDSRIQVHVNETNLGDYPNRNRAASFAQAPLLKYVDADDYLYPTGLEVILEMMGSFPDAGFGLCSLDQVAGQPFPFALSPRAAYLHHYFENRLFHKAPLSSVIRQNAWIKVGGFPEARMVSDFDMWHKLSRYFHVVLMPGGIVWYREHDQQEVNAIRENTGLWTRRYEDITVHNLIHPDCPLTIDEKNEILKRMRNLAYKRTIRDSLKFDLAGAKAWIDHARSMELHG